MKKVFWYSWDLQSLANTRLTHPTGALAPAGVAYKSVQSWLRGARIRDCLTDRRGTYTCMTTKSGRVQRIYWNPSRKVSIRTAATTTDWTGVDGVKHRIGANKSLAVHLSPVLVSSRR